MHAWRAKLETLLPPPPPRTKSLKMLIPCDKEGKARTEKDMDSSHDCKYCLAFKNSPTKKKTRQHTSESLYERVQNIR